jgi:rSAM/selenodomain-associated transferase 1
VLYLVYPVLPNLLILFAKCPVAGRVKTRLCPPLTHLQAASLQDALVRDALDRFSQVTAHDFELHTDTQCLDAWAEYQVSRKLQITGDLGLKMLHALAAALRSGYSRVTILGSDAPTLPLQHVLELTQSKADVALGPALDGGYYAISASAVRDDMFNAVHWSTASALADTENAIRACGLRSERGRWWADLDQPADLERLMSQKQTLPTHTRRWVCRLGSA